MKFDFSQSSYLTTAIVCKDFDAECKEGTNNDYRGYEACHVSDIEEVPLINRIASPVIS